MFLGPSYLRYVEDDTALVTVSKDVNSATQKLQEDYKKNNRLYKKMKS